MKTTQIILAATRAESTGKRVEIPAYAAGLMNSSGWSRLRSICDGPDEKRAVTRN